MCVFVCKYTHFPLIKGFSCLHFHFSCQSIFNKFIVWWNTNYIFLWLWSISVYALYIHYSLYRLFFYFLCLFQSNFFLFIFHVFLPLYHPFFLSFLFSQWLKKGLKDFHVYSIRHHHHHLIFSCYFLSLVCYLCFHVYYFWFVFPFFFGSSSFCTHLIRLIWMGVSMFHMARHSIFILFDLKKKNWTRWMKWKRNSFAIKYQIHATSLITPKNITTYSTGHRMFVSVCVWDIFYERVSEWIGMCLCVYMG